MAFQTVLTLGVALLVLELLTTATGEPLTVALLGVVIAMMSSMAVNDPDPVQQKITVALLPLPAAASVTLGALLAPYMIASDVVFVVIMFAATYARRFGGRGMALGMAAFMTYFFALFLGAKVDQVSWLIGAVLVGTACSFVMRFYVFRDRPDRVLRRTVRALWARVRAVVGATADALQAGRLEERDRRKLRALIARMNETALMVESQIDDKVEAAALWPGVDDEELALMLFDVELAADRLAGAGIRAAAAAETIPVGIRSQLVDALGVLRIALRDSSDTAALDLAAHRAAELPARPHGADGEEKAGVEAYRLAHAISAMTVAAARTQALLDSATTRPESASVGSSTRGSSAAEDAEAPEERPTSLLARLLPTTRQAYQVAVASSLAIIAGEMLSDARWYWAVIAAFVVFTGTSSRGQTLNKGWHRLLGTALGIPAGVLVAALVGGNKVLSIILIFVCIFFAFYLIKVGYSLMIFFITTMLALLYGLLGNFSVDLLVLRLEETAIGAVIGVLAAMLVLPISTRGTVRDGAGGFFTELGELVGAATENLTGGPKIGDLTVRARGLDQQLQELRKTAQPLTHGINGVRGRGSARRTMRVLTACDHYARSLSRTSSQAEPAPVDPMLMSAVDSAAGRVLHNIDTLSDLFNRRGDPRKARLEPAADLLDAAERDAAKKGADGTLLLTGLNSLRCIDQAILGLAHDLGVEDEATALADALPPKPPLIN